MRSRFRRGSIQLGCTWISRFDMWGLRCLDRYTVGYSHFEGHPYTLQGGSIPPSDPKCNAHTDCHSHFNSLTARNKVSNTHSTSNGVGDSVLGIKRCVGLRWMLTTKRRQEGCALTPFPLSVTSSASRAAPTPSRSGTPPITPSKTPRPGG